MQILDEIFSTEIEQWFLKYKKLNKDTTTNLMYLI